MSIPAYQAPGRAEGKSILPDQSRNPEVASSAAADPSLISVGLAKQGVEIPGKDVATLTQLVASSGGQTGFSADALRAIAEEIKRRSRLKVLVWGPGPGGNALYAKRVQIRELLKGCGHEAQFSEEIWTEELLVQTGLNLAVGELLQAFAYDYIVCIMASPGSIGEVHDFAKERRFAGKMMICVDRAHQQGYSGRGALTIFEGLHGKLDWFKAPEDLTECHLSTRVVSQVEKVAHAKQWELSQEV